MVGVMLGITDIANRLGVDRTTVFRWVQVGKLHAAHKMPGQTGALLFTEEEYERFVAERAATAVPEDAA
jgi:predicted site-specific integrase-resolvase